MPSEQARLEATALQAAAAGAAEPAAHWLVLEGRDAAAARAWCASLGAEGVAFARLDGDGLPAAWPATGHAAAAPEGPLLGTVWHVADALATQLATLRSWRSRWPLRPLALVVRDLRDLDHVLALEMGADDVFDAATAAPVVAARLRALERRCALATLAQPPGEAPHELRFGALRLVRFEREVRLRDVQVPLTEGEFEVLWLLASHAGQALSRREILKRVRGLEDQPLDRSIDSRVYRIRAKLGDSNAKPPRIRTVRHQGYAFSPVGW